MDIGVIGYGARIGKDIIPVLMDLDSNLNVSAVTDVNPEQVKSIMNETGVKADQVTFYDSADQMIKDEKLSGILVGTRCSLHTQMAIKVMKVGIPLYLEKPVATNIEDLHLLRQVYLKEQSPVLVSFPLRMTPMVQFAKELVDGGKIGTIEHMQAINNVAYGGVYFHHWYRDEQETGGLFIQKATHDFDYMNYLVGIKPTCICAMASKQIYGGNKPAGLKCVDCQEQETCEESPFFLKNRSFGPVMGEWCCFAKDTGNEDSSSAIIEYESGMHASYSQNFFVKKSSEKRGARLMGYKGTIEFDWCTHEMKVHMHHTPRIETYTFDDKGAHGGGDWELAYNFYNMMKGTAKSVAPLDAGLISTLMCLKAKESAETKMFREIEWS